MILTPKEIQHVIGKMDILVPALGRSKSLEVALEQVETQRKQDRDRAQAEGALRTFLETGPRGVYPSIWPAYTGNSRLKALEMAIRAACNDNSLEIVETADVFHKWLSGR